MKHLKFEFDWIVEGKKITFILAVEVKMVLNLHSAIEKPIKNCKNKCLSFKKLWNVLLHCIFMILYNIFFYWFPF